MSDAPGEAQQPEQQQQQQQQQLADTILTLLRARQPGATC
jgi:hypothetical protein